MKKTILGLTIAIGLFSCEPTHKKIKCVDMQKINGEWINECYELPVDGSFYIYTLEGSFWLRHYGSRLERAGIIDYKEIK